MNRSGLRVLGLVFWFGAAVVSAAAMHARAERSPSDQASAIEYLVRPVQRIEAVDLSGKLQLQDPVFLQQADGRWRQVGHVDAVADRDSNRLLIAWYADADVASHCDLTAHQNRGKLEDVVATLFPPEKQAQIRSRLEQALDQHGDELMRSLLPLVQQTLQQSVPVIEAGFRDAAARHRQDIDQLLDRWNEHLVDQRLVPLARREVIPIVREQGEPIAEAIGRELWDRASLWRFGWRAAYDRSPLPRRDLVQQEWDRFVEEEAIPVFERHTDQIVVAVQRTIAEIAANQSVRDELAGVANSLISDEETMRLVRTLLREAIADNPQLHQVWREVWSSDEAKQAIDLSGQRLEPVVRQIGDDLFGTREEGINPDFARVLRNQILGKDRRWVVATPADVSRASLPLLIQPSQQTMPYPVVYLADRRDGAEESP